MTLGIRGKDRRDEPDKATCFGVRGTRAGYLRHRRAREKPCEQCAAANKKYLRSYHKSRKTDADYRANRAMYSAASHRAHQALARRHAAEFEALLLAELSRACPDLPATPKESHR